MSGAKTIFDNGASTHKPRTWGFRFSMMDVLVISLFMGTVAVLWYFYSTLWWILLMTAVHFFLFCNVFRIVRRLELVWAGIFILNIVTWACFNNLTWLPVLLCQLPVTIVLLIAGIHSPGYHGVFAKQLNPQLNKYLEGESV